MMRLKRPCRFLRRTKKEVTLLRQPPSFSARQIYFNWSKAVLNSDLAESAASASIYQPYIPL